jgi:hypothetical protein
MDPTEDSFSLSSRSENLRGGAIPLFNRRTPMKIIRRIALAIALALIFAAGVSAQDTCKVKIRIVAFNWDDSSDFRKDVMSPNQTDWWLKDGQKKFPGVCITREDGAADYVIAWTYKGTSETYHYTVPTTTTTQHNGTVYGPGGIGGYSGTSTTTTHESKEGEWPVSYVNASVHKMRGTPGEKIPPPIFLSKHKGQWRWSKPDKDAFVKSLEWINKQIKDEPKKTSVPKDASIRNAGTEWPKNN